ncbi:MAG: glycosyltransferase family 2 protein [Thermoplasmata archaeon]
MRASFVVPTLNESESIGHVLRTFRDAADAANTSLFRARPIDWEMIVVDGASLDGTAAIAEAAGARVIVERRKGYGRAYKTGFAAAQGEIIATSDGDATYPVGTIPTLVHRVQEESIDFLTGNRMAFVDRRAMTTEHRIGNRVLNLFLGVAYHHWLKEMPGGPLVDSQSGFWVFRREILDRVHIEQDGMAFSEELKIEAILRGLRVVEVPIRYGERWGRPKLSSWRDGYHNLTFLAEKRLDVAREPARGQPVPFAHGPDAVRPP